jgi:prepilin-type N-terminal cleavage/methylation domain-containing protein
MFSRKNLAFTLIELLTVIAIIGLLIAILVPSVISARKTAKIAAVRAQLDFISKGLEIFNTDFGFYPNSSRQDYKTAGDGLVQGSHRLSFSMLGRDFLGCPAQNPDDVNGYYYTQDGTFNVKAADGSTNVITADSANFGKIAAKVKKTQRKGPYVNANGVILAKDQTSADFNNMTVMCDKFSQRPNGEPIASATLDPYQGRNAILYFKANAALDGAITADETGPGTYTPADNARISNTDLAGYPTLNASMKKFYWGTDGDPTNHISRGGIINTTSAVGNTYPAFNKDTYLLISAGPDNTYFTDDDITNWNK